MTVELDATKRSRRGMFLGVGAIGVLAAGGVTWWAVSSGGTSVPEPSPSASVNVSAEPTPGVSPTVADVVSVQSAPASCETTFECIAGLEETPEGILSEVGAGWIFWTASDADFESYGGPLPEGGHLVLFLRSPDGTTYRLADLDPSVVLEPVVWDSDTSTLIVAYPAGPDGEGDTLIAYLALDPVTGIGEAVDYYSTYVDRTPPCDDCSYVRPSSDGGEVWIALTGDFDAEITVVDAGGTPHTYPYSLPDDLGYYIVWPMFDPNGRWALLEDTLIDYEYSPTKSTLRDVPLRVMDLETGVIHDVIGPDGTWPLCVSSKWADATTLWCWRGEPVTYAGTGSFPSSGLSLVDVVTGEEHVLATWRRGAARIGTEYGLALPHGYVNWNDPWREDPSPHLVYATDEGAIAEIDLAEIFSTAPDPIVDVDLHVRSVGGDWILVEARTVWATRAASLYNPVSGEVIEVLGWRESGEGGILGLTVVS